MRPILFFLALGASAGCAIPEPPDLQRESDTADAPDMAPGCGVENGYCCDNVTCTSPALICQFTPGIHYGRCAACGDATPGAACPNATIRDGVIPNLNDCGQPCCADDRCDSGECMTGRGLRRCVAERDCGHDGQPCCYFSTFCAVGLRCVLDDRAGQICVR